MDPLSQNSSQLQVAELSISDFCEAECSKYRKNSNSSLDGGTRVEAVSKEETAKGELVDIVQLQISPVRKTPPKLGTDSVVLEFVLTPQ